MQDAKKKQKKIQAENNKRVVMQRMQNPNDNLMNYEASDTWFQTRYVNKEKIKRMRKIREHTSNEA